MGIWSSTHLQWHTMAICIKDHLQSHKNHFGNLHRTSLYGGTWHRLSWHPSTPNTCWRCKSAKGDMLHIFWTCPGIQRYWGDIFNLISTVTNHTIPPLPELALLNLTIENIPHSIKHITTHVLLASRLNITRQWKYGKTPTAQTIDPVSLWWNYRF